MDPFVTSTTKPRHMCKVKGCRHRVTATQRRKQGGFCRRCKELRYKATHPYTYTLNKLRNNARRRGIPFDLTLEEWIMFCDLTGYMTVSGRFADNLSVDRIDPKRGYTLDNIRAVTVSMNARYVHVQAKLDRLVRFHDAVARRIAQLQSQIAAA
ncbi:hypothetical protein OpiT1DRAFT_05688 [Opitutaceae bacterium TAV1]|nr:hypothetical protein OpiT1DRAFT_05688 [Opitutaceae bacterium TAV1]